MNKSILSLASIMVLSGLSYAGGDIAQVEPIVTIPEVIADEVSPFYAGLGMGKAYVKDDFTDEEISATTLMLQAGYQFNEYLALEGRYTFGLGGSDYDAGNLAGIGTGFYDGDLSAWGIYVKPMYPIGDFSLYALLGYGSVMLNDLVGGDAVEDSFQWGAGASYAFTEHVSVFADYVSLYDDTGFDYRAKLDDVKADTWTVGLSYKF
jgi:opacity protein-like surface antigen